MIEPWVDVQAELDAINRGEGFYDAGTGRIWINGRLWGTHNDRRTGTVFPIEGEGFIQVTSIQHYAFRTFVRYNGITDQAVLQVSRVRDMTASDLDVARKLWHMRAGDDDP
jgi:hypothetical protein